MPYAAIVPVMFEPTSGLPVVLTRTFVQRTLYGHSFSLCDAYSCAVPACSTHEEAISVAFIHQAPEITLTPAVSDPAGLCDNLHAKRYVCKIHIDDCVVFVVRAKWNTSFVPAVRCSTAAQWTMEPAFATRDVHGKGKTFLLHVKDTETNEMSFALRFIPKEQCFVQCLTLPVVMRSLECRDNNAPPFLPSGVFFLVTTLLKRAVEQIILYISSSSNECKATIRDEASL